VGEIAARAVVQLLFSTGKSFTVDGLREKLREFFREEVRGEMRAVAALSNVELITALLSCNRQLASVGLQLHIINGVVSLLSTRIESKALAAYLSEQSGATSANLQMTTATLEVLACIAFKQPISQAEIDLLFDADKRGLVVKLRDLKLVEEFAGADGRLRFATTQTFFTALRARKLAGIDYNLAAAQSAHHRTLHIKWDAAAAPFQDLGSLMHCKTATPVRVLGEGTLPCRGNGEAVPRAPPRGT
jgi:chromosome segregation and condensation protein ScpB